MCRWNALDPLSRGYTTALAQSVYRCTKSWFVTSDQERHNRLVNAQRGEWYYIYPSTHSAHRQFSNPAKSYGTPQETTK